MGTLLLAIFFPAMLLLISRQVAAYLRVTDEGEPYAEELLRGNVTLGNLMAGRVPADPAGGVVPMREGLLFEASHDEVDIQGTRTVARDVF